VARQADRAIPFRLLAHCGDACILVFFNDTPRREPAGKPG
jgi:hypothetical protein